MEFLSERMQICTYPCFGVFDAAIVRWKRGSQRNQIKVCNIYLISDIHTSFKEVDSEVDVKFSIHVVSYAKGLIMKDVRPIFGFLPNQTN